MQSRQAFSDFHPIVNFIYFAFVLGFSMAFMHPVCLLISLICALAYYIIHNGKKSVRFLLSYAVPVLILCTVINPLFNHKGTVILFYLPIGGNPLTLESIVYGIAAGAMLVSVLLWFGCYNAVMTSDKFVYLFGKTVPALSLMVSMIFRFVPRFKAQFERVKEAQYAMGTDLSTGSARKKIEIALNCFSIMVTWSLENAIDTADSMKSRGYGLKGRTAFSIYTFTQRDKYTLIWICSCAVYMISGALSGHLQWNYFPSMDGMIVQPLTISFFTVYFALCITPIIINRMEDKKWESLKLKI